MESIPSSRLISHWKTLWFDVKNRITYNLYPYGPLQVQNGKPVSGEGINGPAWTFGYGAVNINTDYSWNNFSSVRTSTGGTFDYLGYITKSLGLNMSSAQLGTMIIIHEFEHNTKKGAQETNQDKLDIYNDCIKGASGKSVLGPLSQ